MSDTQVGAATSVAPAGRFLLYVSTVELGADAAEAAPADCGSAAPDMTPELAMKQAPAPAADIQAALEALTDLPASWQQHAPVDSSIAAEGPSLAGDQMGHGAGSTASSTDSRPQTLLFVSYRQSTAVPAQVNKRKFAAPVNVRRQTVLEPAVQVIPRCGDADPISRSENAGALFLQADLPVNAVCCAPPNGDLTFAAALAGASSAFHRLFPVAAGAGGGPLALLCL